MGTLVIHLFFLSERHRVTKGLENPKTYEHFNHHQNKLYRNNNKSDLKC